jgi:hypothetical protein
LFYITVLDELPSHLHASLTLFFIPLIGYDTLGARPSALTSRLVLPSHHLRLDKSHRPFVQAASSEPPYTLDSNSYLSPARQSRFAFDAGLAGRNYVAELRLGHSAICASLFGSNRTRHSRTRDLR